METYKGIDIDIRNTDFAHTRIAVLGYCNGQLIYFFSGPGPEERLIEALKGAIDYDYTSGVLRLPGENTNA